MAQTSSRRREGRRVVSRFNCDACGEDIPSGEEFPDGEEVLCRSDACDCGSESYDPSDHDIDCFTTQFDLDAEQG